MGQVESFQPPIADPNFQEILMIQTFDRNKNCSDMHHSDVGAAWKSRYPPSLPQILQQISFNMSDWENFHSTVNNAVDKFYSDKASGYVLGMLVVVEIILFVLPINRQARSGLSALVWLTFLGIIYYIIQNNEKVDQQISLICQRYNNEWSTIYSNQVSILYQTRFTGCCKPQGARPLRYITISNNNNNNNYNYNHNGNNFLSGNYTNNNTNHNRNVYVANDGTSSTMNIQQPVAVATSVTVVESQQPVIGRVV